MLAKSSHTPRWKKKNNPGMKVMCSVLSCKETTFVSTTLGNSTQLKHALQSMGLQGSSDEIPVPIPLYQHHYDMLYDVVHCVQRQCATCGTWLRYATHRSCTQPAIIMKYLKEHTGFEGELRPHDRVCLTCYQVSVSSLKMR